MKNDNKEIGATAKLAGIDMLKLPVTRSACEVCFCMVDDDLFVREELCIDKAEFADMHYSLQKILSTGDQMQIGDTVQVEGLRLQLVAREWEFRDEKLQLVYMFSDKIRGRGAVKDQAVVVSQSPTPVFFHGVRMEDVIYTGSTEDICAAMAVDPRFTDEDRDKFDRLFRKEGVEQARGFIIEIIDGSDSETEKQSFKIGDKVKCLFNNSGHKYWRDQLEPFVTISRIIKREIMPDELMFEEISGIERFWANDFVKIGEGE